MLSIPGVQPASLHRLVTVVLWVMATEDLKTSRLTDPTISLGNSLQYFMILTAVLL